MSGTARRPSTVLVTGFDPFGGSKVNPSWQAVQAMHGREIGGRQWSGSNCPPCSIPRWSTGARAGGAPARAGGLHRPAAGRSAISLERIAINVNDARIHDNAGRKPIDTPVVAGGPAAYFTSLPIKAMLLDLLEAGINAEVSQTAGTFVCNHVFYGLMHLLARPGWEGTRGGLVHVPWLPEQGQPSMRVDEIVAGLERGIACALRTDRDIRKEAGAIA
ncbi:pyroglutamyl-peptidase I [Ramlibacter terrae]|uniref:Pyroglutamyl-peptidase I n=1 Tax=Ramlibacter terrae TaxID=2732511 RepID=A0ABX6P1D5_9BURK|nr:pyroglutamyl-peptidase I [Ramlibacter terrae]